MNEENKTKLLTALSTREQKHPPLSHLYMEANGTPNKLQ